MIATNAAADLLRHGWQEAARSLASDTPEVADLLEARLQRVIAAHQLDEGHLLAAIDDVEDALAGSPHGTALSRRLRRTVYEYLLALDAARPAGTSPPDDAAASPAQAAGPLVGVEEVAALGHPARPSEATGAEDAAATGAEPLEIDTHPTATPGDATGALEPAAFDAPDEAELPAAEVRGGRRRFAFRRQRPDDATAVDAAGAETEIGAVAAPDGLAAELEEGTTEGLGLEPEAPEVSATPAEAFDHAASADAGTEPGAPSAPTTEAVGGDPTPQTEAVEWQVAAAALLEGGAGDPAEPLPEPPTEARGDGPDAGSDAGGATVVELDLSTDTPADEAQPIVVAPRAGFHIVDDDERYEVAPPADALQPPAPDWQPPAAPPTTPPLWAQPSEPLEYDTSAWPVPAAVTPAPAATPAVPPPPAMTAPDPTPPQQRHAADEDADSPRGWRIRDSREARRSRAAAAHEGTPEDDPFESNAALADLRRRIEDRLRRKRCDEAAALIQSLAQETGGRAVADLALNAGDRCRALGKHNAALNCYLAASRSDPVYEEPLSRLADVCIDSQDTDLAVTYLERVARLQRYRGDDRGALRVLRRIATIAPYREDILAVLMNAQRTGRLD